MILFINENKNIRYADRFDSFNKFLNKLLENSKYKYIDLVDLGLEYSYNGKQNNYIYGFRDVRFQLVEKLIKNGFPNLVKSGNVPVVELEPFLNVIAEFSLEKRMYLAMLLKNFSKIAVFCGSEYDYEHFCISNIEEISISKEDYFLYDGKKTFFIDIEKKIESKFTEKTAFEDVVSSIDGFGCFLSTMNLEQISGHKNIVQLPGNVGSKISFEEILQWISENREKMIDIAKKNLDDKNLEISEETFLDDFLKSNVVFVRKHHPIELFLNQ